MTTTTATTDDTTVIKSPTTSPTVAFVGTGGGGLSSSEVEQQQTSSKSSTTSSRRRVTKKTPSSSSSSSSGASNLKDISEYLVDIDELSSVEPSFREFDGTMYSGLIPFDTSGIGDDTTGASRVGELMFWLFVPPNALLQDNDPADAEDRKKVILWLNGGPGCSSFHAGVLFETAPITSKMHDAGYCCSTFDEKLQYNPYHWSQPSIGSAMLYVEQPGNTGFSHGPTPQNEDDLSNDMYSFLTNFFTIFEPILPLQQVEDGAQGKEEEEEEVEATSTPTTVPFYIFGESYAGMFVPSIARRIHLENTKIGDGPPKSNDRRVIRINLHGIALGNGWMEPVTQGPSVIEYAWWHGMIDTYTKTQLHSIWQICQRTIKYTDTFDGHGEDDDDDEEDGNDEDGDDDLISFEEEDGIENEDSNDDLISFEEAKELLSKYELHEFTMPDECGIMELVLKSAGKGLIQNQAPNTYDVTTWDTYPILNSDRIPYGTFMNFFNTQAVQHALHAPTNITWRGCIPGSGRRRNRSRRRKLEVDSNERRNGSLRYEEGEKADGKLSREKERHRSLFLLDDDEPQSTAPYLATLMDDAGIRVLVYNGDRDLSTNSAGTLILCVFAFWFWLWFLMLTDSPVSNLPLISVCL